MSMLHSSKQTLILLILLPIFITTCSISCENLIRVSQSFKDILDQLETSKPAYPWSDDFIQISENLSTGSFVIKEELLQQLLDECLAALDNTISNDLEIKEDLLQIKDVIHIEASDDKHSKNNSSSLEEIILDIEPIADCPKKITRCGGCSSCWGFAGPRGSSSKKCCQPRRRLATYGNFYALMSSDTTSYPDNMNPVAQYSAVEFPRTNITLGIINNTTEFELPVPGVYEVTWQVPVDQEGQLELWLDQGSGTTGLAYTVVGRRTGNTQIVGNTLVKTTNTNSQVSIRNPNTEALIIPAYERSGETGIGLPASASITIERIG